MRWSAYYRVVLSATTHNYRVFIMYYRVFIIFISSHCLTFIKSNVPSHNRYSKVPVLLPLTIDRFVAVAFPLQHKHWITRRTSRAMISAQWAPCLALVTYQIISFCKGASRVSGTTLSFCFIYNRSFNHLKKFKIRKF